MPDVYAGPGRRSVLALALAAALVLAGAGCARKVETGAALFESPQTNPMALSADQRTLYVANTTSGTVSVLDLRRPTRPRLLAEIPVGLDPVGIAVRPRLDPSDPHEDELVYVTNYISDSISVISRVRLDVVDTIQEIDAATGVTLTDEPTGIAFDGPGRAFVTLDQSNQVWVLDLDAAGRPVGSSRIQITAQAPRALAVSGDRLYVAAFESGNQTQFPSCAPGDPRGPEEGCEFTLQLIESLNVDFDEAGQVDFDLQLDTLFDFAAADPNIGGKVIRNPARPDRDLFVYDLAAPGLDSQPATPGVQPLQVVEQVGTLLYGIAVGAGERVYVTNTEARNHLNGLFDLGNRMFENRVSVLDCAGGCSAPGHVDLDASAGAGATVPTPYGVAASADGATLVVTGAGSDGLAPGSGGTHPGQPELYGLAVLDADGQVLGGVRVGAIPQGVALRSRASNGAAEYAYVLATVDSTLDVVDVRNAASPVVVKAGIRVGSDPTPAVVKAGRIQFNSARASTSGTFSCESCHPNGNIDQVLWTINAVEELADGPPFVGETPEPRTTMPVRGLRDTLPLHWEGNLADPFVGTGGSGHEGPSPGCAPGAENEVACIRHLVNASLSGVMCAQEAGCAAGPSGLPGGLTGGERDEMALFLASLPYPPAPKRRPTDRLSDVAALGVQDFFTNEDGLGINTGVGQVVNFAPATCADNPLGCHSLPLTHSTNSSVVGGFDAPGIRGMTDRHILFSNGVVSSEEALRFAQACAEGELPESRFFNLFGFQILEVAGDPCNLRSEVIEGVGLPLAQLPFPSGEHVYLPEEGITERGAFVASFEYLFTLVYGVRADRIWEYQEEVSVGLPGITGRQISVTPENARDAATALTMAEIEQAAAEGKIAAVGRNQLLGALRYDPEKERWVSQRRQGDLPPGLEFLLALLGFGEDNMSSEALRHLVRLTDQAVTLTAALPPNISIGGADRQPLLDVDPDLRAAEEGGAPPSLPRPLASAAAGFRLGAWYVEPGAAVLVNGVPCGGCGFTPALAGTGDPAIDVVVPAGTFQPGINVMQVLNPLGWASNEFPLVVDP